VRKRKALIVSATALLMASAWTAYAADDDDLSNAKADPKKAAPAEPKKADAPAPVAPATVAPPGDNTPKITKPEDLGYTPKASPGILLLPNDPGVFRANPDYSGKLYEPQAQLDIYGAKHADANQRPLLEVGREMYQYGAFQPGSTLLGDTNLLSPQVLLFGDYRTAVAYNDNGKKEQATWAHRLNLDLDVRLTATERVHAFFRPLDKNGDFTRTDFGGENHSTDVNIDGNVDALFFEGDVGTIYGGMVGQDTPFDLPFAAGIIPLIFQNGIWFQDAITGFAFTLPAKNSPELDISNFDITFFAGFDRVSNAGFRKDRGGASVADDNGANIFGVASFFETMGGYWELDYAYIDDQHNQGRGFNSYGVGFTRRYFNWFSNSVRIIGATGQDPDAGKQAADGFVVLLENSLITDKPSNVVPYFNMFFGFDHPQAAARDAGAGGLLVNTGILFETDGLTGFPKMDDTGINTIGGALGVNILGSNFQNQLVLETAYVGARGDANDPAALQHDQYGVALRYQHPITNAVILRVDFMYAWRNNDDNLSGARFEVRYKF
jgi:hypothetical protein